MRKSEKDPGLHTHKAPEKYRLSGVSTLLDANGQVQAQWVKTARAPEMAEDVIEAFREAVKSAKLPARRRAPKVRTSGKDLLTVVPFGDPHVGMLSWPAETGESFDLKLAREGMLDAMQRLTDLSPASGTCLLVSVGDTLHADGYSSTTTKGTRVDTDSRYPKMLQTAIETFIVSVDLALAKHSQVRVIIVPGNHDRQSGVVLSLCLAAHFRSEPRVQVDTSPAYFRWHEHGKCLLGVTHGDTVKSKDLPAIMATDQAEAWGRTKYRQFYVGHVHHQRVIEYGGCVVESLRTLAPKDAWHHAEGYRAGRGALCDVWHRNAGKILRHEISI